jgi:hypothetical protein
MAHLSTHKMVQKKIDYRSTRGVGSKHTTTPTNATLSNNADFSENPISH